MIVHDKVRGKLLLELFKWGIGKVLEPGAYKCRIPQGLQQAFPAAPITRSPQHPHTIQVGDGTSKTINDLVDVINKP